MPHYKVYYFDFRARAESIRILLSHAAADWEDIRTGDLHLLKEAGKCPYGQLPILEFDGRTLGQSVAILRYLAKEHGLVPEKNIQLAIADGIVDQVQDIVSKIVKSWVEKDELEKEKQVKEINSKILPENIKYFEKILKENGQGKPFFFGDKITYADTHFFDLFNNYLGDGELEVPEVLKSSPDLMKLYNGVMNDRNIHAYLKKRPRTAH